MGSPPTNPFGRRCGGGRHAEKATSSGREGGGWGCQAGRADTRESRQPESKWRIEARPLLTAPRHPPWSQLAHRLISLRRKERIHQGIRRSRVKFAG